MKAMRNILLALVLVLLTSLTQARAGSVHVSVGFGGQSFGYRGSSYGCGYYPYFSARRSYYSPVFYGGGYYGSGYYGGYYPASYNNSDYSYSSYPTEESSLTQPAAPAPQPTAVPAIPTPAAIQSTGQKTPNPVPYGFDIGTKLVKSPWSGFVINGATRPVEQVVYDANTGQAFRIPSLQ
jgi:hypothetical protein